MIFLLTAAALVVGAPLVAAILVSVASRHEDSARTFAGRPPGPLAAAARRLICGSSRPRRNGQRGTSRSSRGSLASTRLPRPRFGPDDLAARTGLPRGPQPPNSANPADQESHRTLTMPRS